MDAKDLAMIRASSGRLVIMQAAKYGMTFDDGSIGDVSFFDDVNKEVLAGNTVMIEGVSNTFGSTIRVIPSGYNYSMGNLIGISVVNGFYNSGVILSVFALFMRGSTEDGIAATRLKMAVGAAPMIG